MISRPLDAPLATDTDRLKPVGFVVGWALLLLLAFAVGRTLQIVAMVAVLTWGAVVLHVDGVRIRSGRRTLALLVAVALLPLSNLFLVDWRLLFIWQAASVALTAYYVWVSPADEVGRSFSRALPALVPALVLWTAVAIGYARAPGAERSDIYTVVVMTATASYIVLAAMYCRRLRDMEHLVLVVIVLSLLQLPVVAGQALGLTEGLPGPLAKLSPDAYGGTVAQLRGASAEALQGNLGGSLRYAGTLLDYELLAEYAGLALLLAVGCIANDRLTGYRWLLVVASVSNVVVGVLTGTRSFLLGVAGGICVLLLLSPRQRLGNWGDRFVRVVAVLGLAVTVVVIAVPGSVTSRYLDRFQRAASDEGGLLNRETLWRTSIEMVHDVPLTGYGGRMMEEYVARSPYSVVASPHSLYFTVLLTAGYPGLAALLASLAVLIYLSARPLRSHDPTIRAWAAVFTAASIYWVVNEAKIESWRQAPYMDLLYVYVGLVASFAWLASRARDSDPSRPETDGDA